MPAEVTAATRKRYVVPPASPGTVAAVAVDAVWANELHVAPPDGMYWMV